MPIPEFKRSYRLKVSLSGDKKTMNLTGVDMNGSCYTLFKSLTVKGLGPAEVTYPQRAAQKQPYSSQVTKNNVENVTITCSFQGHYNEPNLTLTVPMNELKTHSELEYNMIYHVANKRFEQVEVIKSDASREKLGTAQFTTAPAPAAKAQPEVRQPAARQPAAAAAASRPTV